jgi:hypothetical protein
MISEQWNWKCVEGTVQDFTWGVIPYLQGDSEVNHEGTSVCPVSRPKIPAQSLDLIKKRPIKSGLDCRHVGCP